MQEKVKQQNRELLEDKGSKQRGDWVRRRFLADRGLPHFSTTNNNKHAQRTSKNKLHVISSVAATKWRSRITNHSTWAKTTALRQPGLKASPSWSCLWTLSSDHSQLLSTLNNTYFPASDSPTMAFTCSDIFKIILAIILPPLGVFLERGCNVDFLINILLTILGYIPGIIHALYIILKYWGYENQQNKPVYSCDIGELLVKE